MRRLALVALVFFAACSHKSEMNHPPDDAGAGDITTADDMAGAGESDAAPAADDLAPAASDLADPLACIDVTDKAPVVVATAATADEFAFTVEATAASATSWAQTGNQALVLDVLRGDVFVGNLVLHQGHAPFVYGMQVGALAAGETLAVRVSALSAPAATKQACLRSPKLTSATALGVAGEGLKNAPILLWPTQKRFDDFPIVIGWSKTRKHYELVYTNENGGTVVQCGGGADGLQAEVARWGRGADIEGVYTYGASPTWERCTGTVAVAPNAPRMEAAHPIFYYGDGHNRLFESRAGYGATCGTGGPEKADGELAGWNVQNPGSDAAHDGPLVVTVRPLPVDLDSLGYVASFGRREAMLDHYAPWLYRLTSEELTRENKIDGSKSLPMERYLFVDVQAADVDGSGDRECAVSVSSGFVLRVKTKGGATLDGPQMTADYMGGSPAWKRLAIPLDRVYTASELVGMTFDAYDGDGIYFLTVGDAFMPRPSGDNGATLEYVRMGQKKLDVYVDDNSSGCVNGANSAGPAARVAYSCVGGQYDFTP